jgi:hypothetical protein
MGQSAVTQVHHQVFANDNSDADSCTALSTEDSRYEVTPGTTYIVRIKLQITEKNYGDYVPTLRYRVNGGSYASAQVGYDNNAAINVVSGLPTDGDTLTEQLTTAGTYQNGWYEDSSNAQPTRSLNIGSYEFAWAVLANPGKVTASDSIDLQVFDGTGAVDTPTEIDVFSIPSSHIPADYVEQHGWAWYDDDSSDPDTCTAREATPENSSTEILTAELDTAVHLRFHISIPFGITSTRSAQLQYNVGGAGWNNVTTTSNNVRVAEGTPTNSTVCDTELLTNQGPTFTGAGGGDYDDANGVARYSSSVISKDSENQYCIQFRSADLSGGETIQFRLYDVTDSSDIGLGSGASYAQATIQGAGGTVNNKTSPGSDNYAASTDAYVMEKSLRRDISDTLAANDTSLPLREAIRLLLDTAASEDDAIATYYQGPTINEVTLQDLNSIAVSDNSPPERERYRQELETIDLNDLTEEERERIRVLLDEADLSYTAEARHKRTIELLDSWIGMIDSVTATTSKAPQGGTFTDEIDVTDALVMEKSLIRNILDELAALDTAIILRERYRAIFDSMTAADAIDTFLVMDRLTIDTSTLSDNVIELLERNRVLTDALTSLDSAIELRERHRVLLDAIDVDDSATATSAQVVSKTIEDLINVIDSLKVLRERYRLESDGIDISDSVKRQIENVILTSDAAAVTDFIEGERIAKFIETDTAALTDTEIALRERYRVLAETITVLDDIVITVSGTISRVLTDELAAIDAIETLRLLERLITNNADLLDNIAASAVRSQISADSVDLAEFLVNFFARGRIATDSATIIDTAIATYLPEGILTYYKTVIEAFIKHSLQSLSVEHGIERFHIRHSVERET